VSLGPCFHVALLRAPLHALVADGVVPPSSGLLAELARGDGPERVPLAVGYDAWRELEEVAGRGVGIRAALTTDQGAIDLADYLVGACRNLEDAIDILRDHHRLFHDLAYFRVERRADTTSLVVGHEGAVSPPPSMVEWALLTWVIVLRGLMPGVSFLEAHCQHRAPKDHEALFANVPLRFRFEQPENELLIPDAHVSAPNPRADDRLRGLLLAQASRMVAELPPLEVSVVDRVRHELLRRLTTGAPEADDIARALRMSPRTLRRRLEAEGVAFSDLLDAVRRDEALRLVRESSLSFDEISFRLGFSQTTSFHRAFRRWTGSTASALRG
jgi:AraC-like DNA-binding protein